MEASNSGPLINGDDAKALSLLIELVTLAKAGKPYKHLRKPLKVALMASPDLRIVLKESLKNISAPPKKKRARSR